MNKQIYDERGAELIRIEEAEPECGDFCDSCGDCLGCYKYDPCTQNEDGDHVWVQYGEQEED